VRSLVLHRYGELTNIKLCDLAIGLAIDVLHSKNHQMLVLTAAAAAAATVS